MMQCPNAQMFERVDRDRALPLLFFEIVGLSLPLRITALQKRAGRMSAIASVLGFWPRIEKPAQTRAGSRVPTQLPLARVGAENPASVPSRGWRVEVQRRILIRG
jgi:hypothetical protein